ncbi:protein of unknown function [Bradyrhizobium vignae]|uniref:Uncharacterized protein n=1 Tax=Bradyrhizobium vignae TaxID=1549949 RepID=A0A2U3PQ88_9BRAD|nr:protein of unknown function [Bradyrhizobium vignae]
MRSGFPERSCVNNKLKRDDDSSKSHRALAVMVLAVHVGRDDAPIETKRVPKLIWR